MLNPDDVPGVNHPPQDAAVASPNGAHADGNRAPAPPQGDPHLAEVSAALFELCASYVPAFCDGLSLTLTGADASTFTVQHPAAEAGEDGSAAQVDGGQVAEVDLAEPPQNSSGAGRLVIAVHSDGAVGEDTITGALTCSWHDAQRPGELDAILARLLADHAVASARIHALAAALRTAGIRAGNLEQALATNREIGQAIGVLMATHHITAEQAFDKLRTASQHTHRKLREIAAEVAETGVLAATPAPSVAPGSNGLVSAGRARGGTDPAPPRGRAAGTT